jgi:hypothetical protein
MPPPAEAPVVPMDARPRLTFARRVHDDAMVGLNGRVHPEFERIGNPPDTGPVRVSYRLTEVRLEKWVDPTWQVVARKAADANPTGVEEIFGSWAPVPDLSGGDGTGDAGGHAQVKLWLWSANPFDYTRRVGRAWDEWFTDRFSDYPCLEPDAPKETCYDFETIPLSTPLDNGPSSFDPYLPSYRHPDNPLVEIIVDDAVLSGVPLVQILPQPVGGRTRGVCLGPLPDAVPNAPPPPTNSPVVDAIVSSRTEGSPIPSGVNALLSFLPTPNVGVRLLISPEATVLALDGSGNVFFAAAAPRAGDIAEILAPDLVLVAAYWNTNVCLSAVCVLTGHNAEQAARIGLVAQHNLDSVEHFEERGFVLDSHTNYRLVVATMLDAMGEGLLSDRFTPAYTEYAFFKTEGPPKLADLSIPLGQEAQEQIQLKDTQGNLIRNDGTINTGAPVLASELNDLGIYVRQTLPATIPANKERPDLPRPVYRAYDLGVEFNENYVQLMYRLDSRDLALFLFDQNNQPIRDTEGRLVVLRSGWDVAAEPIVDSSEMVWLTTLQLSTCAGTLSLQLQDDEQLRLPGITLDPDSVYEARLNPLLLHEDFNDDGLYQLADSASGTGAVLGRWTVEDQGGGAGTSTWVVQERGSPAQRIVTQTSNYFAGSLDGLVPDKPGTILRLNERAELAAGHVDQPSSWSDYRLSVFVRAADDDAIGVVFRRATATRYYRFSMDRERKYRRLTRHLDGVVTVLAEDEFVYQQDVDYEIVVEAIQDQLVIYQDGERIFSVTDASILQGTVGLYCWGLQVGSFADIRVDDFRETARSAFVYRFTTSRFSNFAHQIHSYQDET